MLWKNFLFLIYLLDNELIVALHLLYRAKALIPTGSNLNVKTLFPTAATCCSSTTGNNLFGDDAGLRGILGNTNCMNGGAVKGHAVQHVAARTRVQKPDTFV